MNAPRKIRAIVISLPADAGSTRRSIRPSQLVPWADPYIASLVRKLQDDVRDDRRTSSVQAEAEMPWNEPFEYEGGDEQPGFEVDLARLASL